jgi:hypothetical protein
LLLGFSWPKLRSSTIRSLGVRNSFGATAIHDPRLFV